MLQAVAVLVFAVSVVLGTSGCALLALPMVGSALSSGAGSVAKLGTERSLGSSARTFSAPTDEVHDTALSTLQRLGVKVLEEERARDGLMTIHGLAYERRVTMKIEPVTPVMTRVTLRVRHGLGKDEPTAAEIVAQIAQDVDQAVTRTARRSRPLPRMTGRN
jgi:hypothetical protein